jgi:hypothetical protein
MQRMGSRQLHLRQGVDRTLERLDMEPSTRAWAEVEFGSFAVANTSPHDVWAVGIRHDATQRHARTLIDHWNGKTWSVVPSPDPMRPFTTAVLHSMAARSPKDAWAAGYYQVGDVYKTLIEHWNGSGWRTVPSRDLAGSQTSSVLAGVSVAPHYGAWPV